MNKLVFVLSAFLPFAAFADPPSQTQYFPQKGNGPIAGSVVMGLDANNVPWPCGSPQVVYGCAGGGSGGASGSVSVTNFPSLQKVIQSGGTAADFSANPSSVPISGYVLLTTVPATAGRAAVEVQNQSSETVQIVRDDGNGTAATVSTVLLAPGASSGSQGGGWSSSTFKGRIRVYGPAGAQVAAFQE